MRTRIYATSILVVLLMVMVFTAQAGTHGEKLPQKNAVLLVAFGTTVPEAMKAFDRIEEQVKKAFPKDEVRWAFTSKIVRKKLRKEGKDLASPPVALAKLLEDGYTHITIASFHSLPGEEFHDLYQDVQAMRQMADTSDRKMLVSWPLLSSRENMEAVLKAILKDLPKARRPGDAVLLMGHGSEHHPGDAVYAALNYYSRDIDPNLFVGTVEGNPKLEDILPKLKKKGIKKVYLVPFMAVAGDHARNDMCGSEADSWKALLTKEGFEVECVLKGTAENPDIVAIWLGNIKKAHAHFE
jgi:sirohydrochlorin cobaltochelatase